MAITNSFRNAVTTRDVRGIRIMMKDSLLVDPTFIEFAGMESLAQSVSGLYDQHDGREFETDKSAWNDDYMNKLMVQVVGNFSRERISHLKEVVGYLRPIASRLQTSAPSNGHTRHETYDRPTHSSSSNYHEQKHEDERNNRILNNRGAKIVAGAAVGGVVGGAGAAIVGSSIVVGAAVGGVIIGVVVAITTNGGQ